ncbi:MAG: LuxR C-terminal-related transcriptional regulator [Chloroflexota bacterium]
MSRRMPPATPVELLSTKIAAPRLRSPLVPRGALLARLDRGLDGKLTLLSAPAGFGKTTLVSTWIASHDAESLPSAWVSLDENDDDPVRFLRYLITACQRFAPGLGDTSLNLLHAPQPTLETALTLWLNELTRLDHPCVLILEDYHVISSPRIQESVAFLLDHLPTSLHLVITTRTDPPLPLARLRARDELSELHAADLRFSTDETRAFIQQVIPFAISAEAITRLETHTEGWAAGLRLAALALTGRDEAESLLATFDGSHKHVMDYLISEVFARQPAPIQQFLLETAFLSRLSADLCDSVSERDDSAAILDALEHANLFLTTGDGKWFRYHALFSEAMQHYAARILGAQHVRNLQCRASHWYEQHQLIWEAVETALDAHDFERAAFLLEHFVEPMQTNNELSVLRRLIERLPSDLLPDYPDVCLAYAVCVLFTSDRSAHSTWALLKRPLEWAEACFRAQGRSEKLGEILAFRSLAIWWQEDPRVAFDLAHQAVALLREDQLQWRAICTIELGAEAVYAGHYEVARRQLIEGQALSRACGNEYGKRAALGLFGDLLRREGELNQAEQIYQQILLEAVNDPSDQHCACIGLSALAYEWNDLVSAEQYALRSLALAEELNEGEFLVQSALALAPILLATGQVAQAAQWINRVEMLPEVMRCLRDWPNLLAYRARIAFLTNEVPPLPPEIERDDRLRIIQEQQAILKTRIVGALGNTAAALALLDDWQPHNGSRVEVEMLALRALLYYKDGQLARAKQSLVRALVIAQPSGYRRLFLDEGVPMAALLQETLYSLSSESLRDYVRLLLADFTGDHSNPAADPVREVEPLSPQEHRVLTLLSSGLTNPEIAQELVVSINTIKTQVKSIYRKLNVSSRPQACAMLRSMNVYLPRA